MRKYPFELMEPAGGAVPDALSEYGIAFLPDYLDDADRVTAAEKEAPRKA